MDILSHANGQYVTGVQQLGGSFGDDITVAALRISADGGETYYDIPFDPAAVQWAVEIDTATFVDGERDVRIQIEDTSTKSAEKKLLLYFDNHAPVVVVKNPQGYKSTQFNDDITIRGEAVDYSGIVSVEVELLDEAGNPVQQVDADGNPTTDHRSERSSDRRAISTVGAPKSMVKSINGVTYSLFGVPISSDSPEPELHASTSGGWEPSNIDRAFWVISAEEAVCTVTDAVLFSCTM